MRKGRLCIRLRESFKSFLGLPCRYSTVEDCSTVSLYLPSEHIRLLIRSIDNYGLMVRSFSIYLTHAEPLAAIQTSDCLR